MTSRTESWTRISPRFRTILGQVPQSAPAARLARNATRRNLRVLAFHGVPDLAKFDRVVTAILRDYEPVSESDVAAAIEGHYRLPNLAVWFTFDDGLRSTFDAAQLLADHGVSATAFVCPAVIGQPQRLWFQSAEEAAQRGIQLGREDSLSTLRLKVRPDSERRALVAELESRLDTVDPAIVVHVEDLEAWRALGHTVGNHTWDHPCLDTCSAEDQKAQVMRAHDQLVGWGIYPRFFAYPNGNFTPIAADVAQALGYAGSLLFDHALSSDVAAFPHQISRLRIDSDVDTRRALSILSGAHSFAHHLVLNG